MVGNGGVSAQLHAGQGDDVKEVIDVFASFSENSAENQPRSGVSENPFADKE